MSTTDFTPERSAAIRQLLLDTVADEPRRRKRLQILLTSLLSAVAIVLAGGTAALALTGVIHLGSGDAPPAPVPTPTQSVTPTPTPTATPTPTTRPIAVQSAPIVPRDVTTPPGAPAWSLDLPGSGDPCEQVTNYNIADGLALVQTGAVAVGDGPGCSPEQQNVSLTLVDTNAGKALWTRHWEWTPDPLHVGREYVMTTVLSTSGHILIYDLGLSGGPHEVLQLSDGTALGSVEFPEAAVTYVLPQPVPGDSGDVLLGLGGPAAGTPPRVVRVDPLDVGHPRWTTVLPGTGVVVGQSFDSDRAVIHFQVEGGGGSVERTIDATTGALSDVNETNHVFLASVDVSVSAASDGGHTAVARDTEGNEVWTRHLAADQYVQEVVDASSSPGQPDYVHARTDDLAIVSGDRITLVDGTTGDDIWTSDRAGCASDTTREATTLTLSVDARTIMVATSAGTCRWDAHDGVVLPQVDYPAERVGAPLLGRDVVYPTSYWDEGGTASAYDLATGPRLWTVPTQKGESWRFLGGVLVRQIGDHLEAVG